MKNAQIMVRGKHPYDQGGPIEGIRAVLFRETIIIASTEGSVSVPDREEKIGLNVYRKK